MSSIKMISYDLSGNLQQLKNNLSKQAFRMFTSSMNNRAIDQLSFDQDPDINQHFDPHGNQLKAGYSHLSNTWDYFNQLQTTIQPLENGYTLTEYNTFGVPGQRTRKVSEISDPSGNIVEIRETLYQNDLEYLTLWQGTNLEYDGETVTDNGQKIPPTNSYQARRIRQNHRQLAQENIQDNQDQTATKSMAYYLDNHLDSCELLINEGTQLESYQSFDPFGNTVETFGDTQYKTVKYSGEIKDQTGLYNYGFRSYLPDNFRWTSPDPAKQAGSGLNRYAMVGNNPISQRDLAGLSPRFGSALNFINYSNFIAAYLNDLFSDSLKYKDEKKYVESKIPTSDRDVAREVRQHWKTVSRFENNLFGEVHGPGWQAYPWSQDRYDNFSHLFQHSYEKRLQEMFLTKQKDGDKLIYQFSKLKEHQNLGIKYKVDTLDELDSKYGHMENAMTNVPYSGYFLHSVNFDYYPISNMRRNGLTGAYETETGSFLLLPNTKTINKYGEILDKSLLSPVPGSDAHQLTKTQLESILSYYKFSSSLPNKPFHFIGFTVFQEKTDELQVEFVSYSLNGLYNIMNGTLPNKNIGDLNAQPPRNMQIRIAQELADFSGLNVHIRQQQFREHFRKPDQLHFRPNPISRYSKIGREHISKNITNTKNGLH